MRKSVLFLHFYERIYFMQIITVSQGDTLTSLANQYNIPQFVISSDNALQTQSRLIEGQALILRTPSELYTASFDTTIDEIARQYNTTSEKLFRNNLFLNGNNQINSGESIVISFADEPTLSKIIGGYAYEFIEPALLDTYTPFMTYLMPFTYGFRPDGSLIDLDDSRLIAAANTYGARPLMHISTLTENGNFSSTLATNLFNDTRATDTLIQNILENVRAKGYYGVDVDFEFLPVTDAQNYVDFISRLTDVMNQNGYICIVALPPKTSDTQIGLLYEGIDYAGLGESANYVLVMTYEWGYRFGPPLAIAPIPSVRRVLDYTVSRIEQNKILLGISNYGYDWTLPFERGVSDAPSISNRQALDLAIKYNQDILFDETDFAPYFFYTDDLGLSHEVWFEDARSFSEKVNLIKEYNLAGGFVWDLMRENNQGFATLDALLNIPKQ